MAEHCNWKSLTREELLHLIEGDEAVQFVITAHLACNLRGQKALGGKCFECDGIARKLGLGVSVEPLTELDTIKLVRWLLHYLGFTNDSLDRAKELLSRYKERR